MAELENAETCIATACGLSAITAVLGAYAQPGKHILVSDGKYGRTVGVVLVDNVNVNQSLITAGLVWQYRKYCKAWFCPDWLQLEKKARSAKIGLWSDTDPVAPWEWRKGARSSNSKIITGTYAPATVNYHGNTKSHVLHTTRCRHYNCKNCTKTFQVREEAITAGYRPDGQCKP